MSGVNKVILLGRLGKDPELKSFENGNQVCTFSLATSREWLNDKKEKQEQTEWHNVVIWGKLAAVAKNHLAKGRQVYLEGSNQTRSWDDKEGRKCYITEVVCNTLQFCGSKEDGNGGNKAPPPQQQPGPASQGNNAQDFNSEDIPF